MHTLFIDTSTVTSTLGGTGRYARDLARILARHYRIRVNRGCWHPHEKKGASEKAGYHRELSLNLAGNRTDIRADFSFFPNYFLPPHWPYPAAVTIHDVSFLSHPHFYKKRMVLYYKSRIKHSLSNALYIITVSEASKQAIQSYLGVQEQRILVHQPGIPLQLQQVEKAEKGNYLLYVGTMEPKKGVLEMIRAFKAANNPNGTHLVLAGKLNASPSWVRAFKRETAGNKLIVYKGYVDDTRLQEYMAHARGLLLLSHIEGFGLPVMDALCNGIPVLVSKDPALNEVAGGVAHSVEVTDHEQVVQGIERMLHGTCTAEQVVYSHQAARFSEARYEQQVLDLTDRLLCKKGFYYPDSVVTPVVNPQPDTTVPQSNSRTCGGPEHIDQSTLQADVLAAIAYAGAFGSGIGAHKLNHSQLVRSNLAASRACANTLVSQSGGSLECSGLVYAVSSDIVPQKSHARTTAAESERIRKKHHRTIRLLAACSWVEGMYYSGGTVHQSGLEKKPDLDVLVVTAKHRVWLVYVLVRLLSYLTGKGHSFCSNYIVDSRAQEINWQRDYFTAHQLLFVKKVVLKRGAVHVRACNKWVYDFFPNAPRFKEIQQKQNRRNGVFLPLLNYAIMALNSYRWKRRGLRSGSGGMLWDVYRIKGHTNDHRPEVSARFARIHDTLNPFLKKHAPVTEPNT